MASHPVVSVQPSGPTRSRSSSRLALQAMGLVAAAAMTLAVLVGITVLVAPGSGPATATPGLDRFLVRDVRPAPAIELTDADARPFSLASMRGKAVLVFFGYTQCPDVCPATTGNIGKVLAAIGSEDLRAVFVSVDPERDTPAWLKEYLRYIPAGFDALTGAPDAIRSTADAWGVRYAKVETGTPGKYSMSHTADVYLVDRAGLLRADFPFGTEPDAITSVVRQVMAGPEPSIATAAPVGTLPPTPAPPTATPISTATATPTAVPSTSPVPDGGPVQVDLVSSSIWAGNAMPVIFNLRDALGRINDSAAAVTVELQAPSGPAVRAVAVQPPGIADVSYVATLDVAGTGWRPMTVTISQRGVVRTTSATLAVNDPGTTALLGAAAPAVRTPTLADVGNDVRELTTDPLPDQRLYTTSTADALRDHRPFVLVIDSTKFRTSPACGKALVLARYLLDRWPDVAFIHLEPFEFSLISDTPVLTGSLSDPTLVAAADAWGIGGSPWGATSMPWMFVVDGNGIVRAKYQGVIGSADVDVILSLVAQGG